jgi:uncharacterized SAM-binding protein YcdF (DUF218 family)
MVRRKHARRRLGWRSILALAGFAFVAFSMVWAMIARALAPAGNASASRVDTLIVLGVPADQDGNPQPAMLARMNEAVREYERGVAPRMILTGGFDGRRYREAVVMARVAQAQGVPASAIFVEPDANDTIQNACYSARIMKAHNWRSAEVIAASTQLPRAGIIFSRLPIEWRSHAAPPMLPPSSSGAASEEFLETLKTARYLLYARRTESCSP